jgi:predicted MPP superfamily phosphohydrolase
MLSTAVLLRVLAFVGAVGFVFTAAAWELLRIVLERRGRIARPGGRARRAWRRAVLSAAGLGVLCIGWGFVEPWWPEITERVVPVRGVPAGTPPVRLVHLSDLHCDPKVRLEDRLPGLVAACRPDLIVFTGDCINHPGGLDHFRRTVTALATVAPVFVVKGNWDTGYWSDLDLFGGTGARELDGDGVRFDAGRGANLWIAGMRWGHGASGMDAALAGRPTGAGTVFAVHSPDHAYELADRDVDLVLSGHTHGGQVALPFYGALVTLSRFDKRFEGGLYRVRGPTWMNVSRGIGMEGGLAPRVRFAARPEIGILELVPADTASEER